MLLSYLLFLALRLAFLRAPFLLFDLVLFFFRGLFPPFSLLFLFADLPSLFEAEPSPVTLPSPGETHIFSMFFTGRVPAGQQFVMRGIFRHRRHPNSFTVTVLKVTVTLEFFAVFRKLNIFNSFRTFSLSNSDGRVGNSQLRRYKFFTVTTVTVSTRTVAAHIVHHLSFQNFCLHLYRKKKRVLNNFFAK